MSKIKIIIYIIISIIIWGSVVNTFIYLENLYDLEVSGEYIIAEILQMDPATNKVNIIYTVNNEKYKKNIKLSNNIYRKLEDNKTFLIKVEFSNPNIISWKGNKNFDSKLFQLSIGIFLGSFMIAILVVLTLTSLKYNER